MSTQLVMPSKHLILCCPLLLLPSVLSCIRVFSSESVLCIRWSKYCSISFSITPSDEYSGLISFRIDWFDLLAFQGTLKSLLQHHSSKASILWQLAFFMVQLPHLLTRHWHWHALTRWIFVGKVTSLLFNMLSRLVNSLWIPQTHFVQTCLHPFHYPCPPSSCISFFRRVALTLCCLNQKPGDDLELFFLCPHHIQLVQLSDQMYGIPCWTLWIQVLIVRKMGKQLGFSLFQFPYVQNEDKNNS